MDHVRFQPLRSRRKAFRWLHFSLAALIFSPMLSSAQDLGNPANAHMHRHDFDELVARFEAPERAVWQKPEMVISLLQPLEGKAVADIGAGSGYFTFRIAAEASRVIAIDIDPRFIDYIVEKGNPKVEARLTTPYSPGLRRGEADAVLIVNVYHHIDDRVNYLKEVKAGMADGGVLLIVDYKKEETPHCPPVEIRVAQSEVEAEVNQAGFTVEVGDRGRLPEQYILKARQ